MRRQISLLSRTAFLVVLALTAAMPGAALATVTISSAATANMTCGSGLCSPTAAKAVLNVDDLEALLEAGNVEVSTSGSGVQAKDIEVAAALTWSSTSSLSLDAYRSMTIARTVSVAGAGGLSITTNDGGSKGRLAFGPQGKVQFAELDSVLKINGMTFTLINSVATLAGAIAADPGGSFGLAADYDAAGDGTYSDSPVATTLSGFFEGLGNTISHVSIVDRSKRARVGFFSNLASTGTVDNLRLMHERIQLYKNGTEAAGLVFDSYGVLSGDEVEGTFIGRKCYCYFGGLAGGNNGSMTNSHAVVSILTLAGGGALAGGNFGTIDASSASGSVRSLGDGLIAVGGLVGTNGGTITNSNADVAVVAGNQAYVGGLVGEDEAYTQESYATGNVTGGDSAIVGGLDGYDVGATENSYATGAVEGGEKAFVGGLLGEADVSIQSSYSLGAVSGNTGSFVGGLIGVLDDQAVISDTYWDTTTSGADQGTGMGNVTGITGLTSQQLQTELPEGFKKKIWAESSAINGGFPYLLGDPPKK